MSKHTRINTKNSIGHYAETFVTGVLGLDPKQHKLTSNAAWIRLAERLLRVEQTAITDRSTSIQGLGRPLAHQHVNGEHRR